MDILGMGGLGTAAAVSAAVATATQLTKQYFPSVDPKWVALAWAAAISIGQAAASGSISVETAVSVALNALLAAGAAIGAYEGAKGAFGGKGD